VQPASRTDQWIASVMSDRSDAGPHPCRFRYLLCSAPRTGSSWVGAALRATAQAGIPYEYLNPRFAKAYARRFDRQTVSLAEYLRFLESAQSTANGVFGLKMHFEHLTTAFTDAEKQAAFLKRIDRFVVISRRNLVAQALSFLKAAATDVWNTDDPETLARVRTAPFSPSTPDIAHALAQVAAQNAAWPRRLDAAGVDFITLYYEDFVADFAGETQRLVAHLAIPELGTAGLAQPGWFKLADQRTDELQDRFLRAIVGLDRSAPSPEDVSA
jgi:trehalose 2-sulfotransferase